MSVLGYDLHYTEQGQGEPVMLLLGLRTGEPCQLADERSFAAFTDLISELFPKK